MTPSAIFRVDASPKIGMGHYVRCLALSQEFRQRGMPVTFVTKCRNDKLIDAAAQEGIKIETLDEDLSEDEQLYVLTELSRLSAEKKFIVLDLYELGANFEKQLCEAGLFVVSFDDECKRDFFCDVVVNQNFGAELRHKYKCPKATTLLLGSDFVPLRREFRARASETRELPSELKKVMVLFGGSDPARLTGKVLEAIERISNWGAELTLVAGAENQEAQVLAQRVQKSKLPVELVVAPDDLSGLMFESDLAITASGSTVWELALCGTPMIVRAVAQNQEPIARALKDKNLAKVIEDVSEQAIANVISEAAESFEWRASSAHNLRQICDGKGAARIADAILARLATG